MKGLDEPVGGKRISRHNTGNPSSIYFENHSQEKWLEIVVRIQKSKARKSLTLRAFLIVAEGQGLSDKLHN